MIKVKLMNKVMLMSMMQEGDCVPCFLNIRVNLNVNVKVNR